MNRRDIIKGGISGIVLSGVLLKTHNLKAQSQDFQLTLDTMISTNHGHQLELQYNEVVDFLVQTENQEILILDIKGSSSHKH